MWAAVYKFLRVTLWHMSILSARILPPRREIKSLLWRLKSPPGGRCPPPVRARGAVFFRRAAAILLLCGTASQSRLTASATGDKSLLAKNAALTAVSACFFAPPALSPCSRLFGRTHLKYSSVASARFSAMASMLFLIQFASSGLSWYASSISTAGARVSRSS